MMTAYHSNFIIAIDPDITKSGVATLDCTTRNIVVQSLPFPNLLKYLQQAKEELQGLTVVIESGWKINNNWHLRHANIRTAASIGNSVGRNHAVGILLSEWLHFNGFNVIEQMPLKKCWKGNDGKITAEELRYFTHYDKRTNQDERDAILLAWYTANFPIRIKC